MMVHEKKNNNLTLLKVKKNKKKIIKPKNIYFLFSEILSLVLLRMWF